MSAKLHGVTFEETDLQMFCPFVKSRIAQCIQCQGYGFDIQGIVVLYPAREIVCVECPYRH